MSNRNRPFSLVCLDAMSVCISKHLHISGAANAQSGYPTMCTTVCHAILYSRNMAWMDRGVRFYLLPWVSLNTHWRCVPSTLGQLHSFLGALSPTTACHRAFLRDDGKILYLLAHT